ncbi:MAG: hypothetical protein IPQ07_07870 [Myxococcales bacterium]|nr:hypothetical protein [Myxococcales bacterium]
MTMTAPRRRLLLLLAALSAVTALGACGSTSTLPPGAVCDQTSECDPDLTCLEIAQVTATSCTVVGKTCSTTCINDASCAPLGADFRCFATCTADKVCGELAAP